VAIIVVLPRANDIAGLFKLNLVELQLRKNAGGQKKVLDMTVSKQGRQVTLQSNSLPYSECRDIGLRKKINFIG